MAPTAALFQLKSSLSPPLLTLLPSLCTSPSRLHSHFPLSLFVSWLSLSLSHSLTFLSRCLCFFRRLSLPTHFLKVWETSPGPNWNWHPIGYLGIRTTFCADSTFKPRRAIVSNLVFQSVCDQGDLISDAENKRGNNERCMVVLCHYYASRAMMDVRTRSMSCFFSFYRLKASPGFLLLCDSNATIWFELLLSNVASRHALIPQRIPLLKMLFITVQRCVHKRWKTIFMSSPWWWIQVVFFLKKVY